MKEIPKESKKPNLFQLGFFKLHSGSETQFKIDCDHFTSEDWDAIAAIVAFSLPPFVEVIGVPRGGVPFAKALKKYRDPKAEVTLVVDDVLTTGHSLFEIASQVEGPVKGFVVFSRRMELEDWVDALFYLNPSCEGL